MEVKHDACAGTAGNNDILIRVLPGNGGLVVRLESCMKKLYGKTIERAIRNTAAELGVSNAVILAQDNGALDYTICARVETALKRSAL